MTDFEVITKIQEAILNLEATSNKCGFFNYHGHIQKFDVHVTPTKNNYVNWLMRMDFYLGRSAIYNTEFLKLFYVEMEKIANIPDVPNEEMVTVQLPKSRAIELGVA